MGPIKFGMIVLFGLVMLAAPLASAVAEDEPDGTWRAPPIGTKATYNFGQTWEVVAVEGGKVHVKGDRSSEKKNTKWYKYRGLLDSKTFDGRSMSIDTAALDALFPLNVGNKATVHCSAGEWKLKINYEVVSRKGVKTILGVRQLFKIEFTERASDYRAHGWGYYDPEYGVWIGGDYNWGNRPTYKWRLVHLDLPE